MTSHAFVPVVLHRRHAAGWAGELSALIFGVAVMGLLAQIAVKLPWSPVPITGQTLGVALISLLWGRDRAALVMLSYVLLGVGGVPLFALKGGFLLGPTFGYLVGMMFAAVVVGWFADLGASRTFGRALTAAYFGSAITFACGLWGLSFFVPARELLWAGLIPFLPGDLIKNILAAWIATRSSRILERG